MGNLAGGTMKSRTAGIFLLTVCCCVRSNAGSSTDSQLPSISELEKVTFTTERGLAPVDSSPPYAEVSGAKRLFLAYDAEAKAIGRYRDPVLTRGAQGEAIFKSVSPAVVAVVVGRVDKDSNFDPEG